MKRRKETAKHSTRGRTLVLLITQRLPLDIGRLEGALLRMPRSLVVVRPPAAAPVVIAAIHDDQDEQQQGEDGAHAHCDQRLLRDVIWKKITLDLIVISLYYID